MRVCRPGYHYALITEFAGTLADFASPVRAGLDNSCFSLTAACSGVLDLRQLGLGPNLCSYQKLGADH